MDDNQHPLNPLTPPPAYRTPAPLPEEEKQKAKKALNQVVGASHDVLITATTVFPFTLFPDTITIDRAKLTVAHRTFFKVAEVISIRIEDVLNVTANVGPFFGSLKISTRFFDTHKPYTVNYLWRNDALRIKRIMQGYIIALQKKVDCSALSTGELAHLLDELGQGAPEDD